MDSSDIAWALAALGHPAASGVALDGSRSGSGVFRVRLDGTDAVLKVTRGDPTRLVAARREAAVYLGRGPTLPLRTPRLIDHRDTEDAVILLLAAHQAAVPSTDWTHDDWLRVARELAALHSMSPPDGPLWAHGSPLLDDLAHPHLDVVSDFWAGDLPVLGPLLGDLPSLAAVIAALEPTFVHGDCHTANLLPADDGFVWIDWQAAGIGNPAEDLAFPSVRSVPDGADVPWEAMLTVYAECRGLDIEPLRTAVRAA